MQIYKNLRLQKLIVAKGINNIIVLTIVISFLSRITIHLIQEAMIFLPFFALSLNATPFFFYCTSSVTPSQFPSFSVRTTKSRCSRLMLGPHVRQGRREGKHAGDGESPSRATGGFRSMHPYARLPTRVRRPASSPDVILPYPRDPGLSLPPRAIDTDATAGVDQTEISSFEKWIGPPSHDVVYVALRRLRIVS